MLIPLGAALRTPSFGLPRGRQESGYSIRPTGGTGGGLGGNGSGGGVGLGGVGAGGDGLSGIAGLH